MKIKNMTLRAQLYGVILFVLVMSFIGSVSINIINTQQFLNNQLTSHAQDTATSLGLSLSDPILHEQQMLIEGSIDAIFDRGFYHHITLKTVDGETCHHRQIDNQPEQVPAWFIDMFPLQAPEQTTQIDTGWVIGGILTVQSHTGLAYLQLWENAIEIIWATLFIFLLALLFASIFLREMYKPINAISLQAEAVQRRDFVMIEKLPRALELRNFVFAMNKMVANIKNTFDELTQAAAETHNAAYIDPQTGIENRRAFIDAMDALLSESSQQSGYMVMARINGLSALNKNQGYQAGDNIVLQLIDQINVLTQHNTEIKLFRISGSEFTIFLENYQLIAAQKLVTDLIQLINRHIESPNDLNIVIGCIDLTLGQAFSELMFELDLAANVAAEKPEKFHIHTDKQDQSISSMTNYKMVLDSILSAPDTHIQLTCQHVHDCSIRRTFDVELFAAFTYQGNSVNTGDVFAVASQYQRTGLLDHTIIEMILKHCASEPLQGKKIAINLSRLTIADDQAMASISQLIKASGLAKFLTIGLPESSILGSVRQTKANIELLSVLGCAICINRFGSSMESLQYLMEIRPDHVKLLPAFTRNIDKKTKNAQMVGAFVRLVHGLDITVIAHCVETQDELVALQKLNIDAVLGYVIDKPTPING